MRAIRVIQLVFIALGLLCLVVMLGMFFFEGSRFTFTYSCNDIGLCNGTTSDSPSGFDMGVALGLLGIGLEVAAAALGQLAAAPAGSGTSDTMPTSSATPTSGIMPTSGIAPGTAPVAGGSAPVPGQQPYPPMSGTGPGPGQQPYPAPQQPYGQPYQGPMQGGHPG